jgi:peptide/nickel transport system substrate-binding protein
MHRKHVAVVAFVCALALAVAACGGDDDSSGNGGKAKTSSAPAGSVVIANTQGQTWTCGFNPFNPSTNTVAFGPVYEPLIFVNALKNQAATPMLATAYKWSADKKTLTFTIRDGVKWSDGQPFTIDDVLYTFDLIKKYDGLDINAIYSGGLIGATKSGTNDVVLTFKSAAEPYFFYVAGQVPIVPKHVWSTGDAAKDPVQYQDAHPIGTGPFEVNPCNPNLITYTRNPSYWQKGLPHLQKVLYPAYLDNPPANLDLANGKAQWGSQFIPNVEKFYLAKDKENHHIWFPPLVNVSLWFNLKKPVTSNVDVRKAFAYGIDRAEVARVGEGGQQEAANQSGIVLPTYKDWYDQSTADEYKPDATKAKAALADAGYSTSKPLSLSVITISGYTDWDASLQEIKQQVAPLGIKLDIQDLAQNTFEDKLFKGDFDLAYYSLPGGPAPYYELRQLLYSANSAPLGQAAASNYERYSDPKTDALFDEFASADTARQHEIVDQLQRVMLDVVPVVPTTQSVDWFQYNTKNTTGWPTEQNPYARPAAYEVPDLGIVMAHLQSK